MFLTSRIGLLIYFPALFIFLNLTYYLSDQYIRTYYPNEESYPQESNNEGNYEDANYLSPDLHSGYEKALEETRTKSRRRKRQSGSNNNIKLNIAHLKTSVHKIDIDSFVSKHVTSMAFPSDKVRAENVLISLQNKIPDKFYARDKQTLTFPSNPANIENQILTEGSKILNGNPTIKRLDIDNKPFSEALKDMTTPNTPNKFDKAYAFLVSNQNIEIKNFPSKTQAISHLVSLGETNVQLMMESYLDRSVVFEVKTVIKLSTADTGKTVLIERNDVQSTTRPTDVGGWDMTEVFDSVTVSLYTKVEVPEGKLLSTATIPSDPKWEVHLVSDLSTQNPTVQPIKLFPDPVKPKFLTIDQFEYKKSLIYQKEQDFTSTFNENLKQINFGPEYDVLKSQIDTLSNELGPIQKEIKNDATSLKQIDADLAAAGFDSKRNKNDPAPINPDFENLNNRKIEIETNLRNNRMKAKMLNTEISDLEMKANIIRDTSPKVISLKKDYLKKRQTIAEDFIKQINSEKQFVEKHFVGQELQNYQNTAVKAILVYDNEINVNLKLETQILNLQEQLSKSYQNNDLEQRQRIQTDLEEKMKQAKLLKNDKPKNKNNVNEQNKSMEKAKKASLNCPGKGRRRKRGSCDISKPKNSALQLPEEKLQRVKQKRNKFKQFKDDLFSSKSLVGNTDVSKLKLEKTTNTKNLKKKISSNKFLRDILGITEIEKIYMGRKTLQNSLNQHKAPSKLKKSLGKISKGVEVANYAFLIRDFTKAAITGDKTTMAIMGTMTGVQVVATGLSKVAKSGITTLKTAKGLMVASRLLSGGLSLAGIGFDIYSIVNSGTCLRTKKENTQLCLRGSPECQIENDVCGGRDAIADIIISSLSIAGTLISLAFPAVAPFVAIFSFVLTIFNEVHQANKFLDNFEKDIPLSEDERAKEFLRKLIGQNVSDYLEDLREQKRINTGALENIRQFLIANQDMFWAYFGPGYDKYGNPLPNNIVRVRDSEWANRSYHRWSPDPNRMIEGAKVNQITDFNYFCRPVSSSSVKDVGFLHGYSYYCKDAVGIRIEIDRDIRNLSALFRLEDGRDEAIGFEYLPNYFEVGKGYKEFVGGVKDDVFVVSNRFEGTLDGSWGENILQISDNVTGTLEISNFDEDDIIIAQKLQIENKVAVIKNIRQIQGRKVKKDIISVNCGTRKVDGGGGSGDLIRIGNLGCKRSKLNLKVEVHPGTQVENEFQKNGTFVYNFRNSGYYPSEVSKISIQQANEKTVHEFVFFQNPDKLILTVPKICSRTKLKARATYFNAEINIGTSENFCKDFSIGISTKEQYVSMERNGSNSYARLNISAVDLNFNVRKSGSNYLEELQIRSEKYESRLRLNIEYDSRNPTLMANAVSKDGALVLIVSTPLGNSPMLYFSLSELSHLLDQDIVGSKRSMNLFDVSDGNFRSITGGSGDDQFRLSGAANVSTIRPGGGSNGLELKDDNFDIDCLIDLPEKYLQWGWADDWPLIQIEGEFNNIIGRESGSDHVSIDCAIKHLDLRGYNDIITIPYTTLPCRNERYIYIQLHPGTIVNNLYSYNGTFVYNLHEEGNAEVQLNFHPETNIHDFSPKISIKLNSTTAHPISAHVSRTNDTLIIEIGVLNVVNLQYSSSFLKPPTIMTVDEAVITIAENNDGDTVPIFYFELTDKSVTRGNNVIGSQIHSNAFKIINGTFKEVKGGSMNNRFTFLSRARVQKIVNVDDPSNESILEVEDGNVKINLNLNFMLYNGFRTELRGIFRNIIGGAGKLEELVPDYNVRSINLKGGINEQNPDLIVIEANNGNGEHYDITTSLEPFTHFINRGSNGTFTYIISSDGNFQLNELKTIKTELFQTANDNVTNLFSIQDPAEYLQIFVQSDKNIRVTTPSKELKLTCYNSDCGSITKILSGEQAEILILNNSSAAFKFILNENKPYKRINGGKHNTNYFIIDGAYEIINGGSEADVFIIGENSDLNMLNGGDGEDVIEFTEKIYGTIQLELDIGFVTFEDGLNKMSVSSSIVHIKGRSSGVEQIVPSCQTRTIDLQGSPANSKDLVYIKPLQECESYDLLIKYTNSKQFLVLNGLSESVLSRSKIFYQIDELEGEFKLVNIYDPNSEENVVEDDVGSAASASSNGEFVSLPFSFLDLKSIELFQKHGVVKIKHGNYNESISFQTIHVHNTTTLDSIYINDGEWVLEDDEEMVDSHFLVQENYFEENSTQTNETEWDWDSSVEEEPEPEEIDSPPIRLPVFVTMDNYEIFINHLGGIHAVTTIKNDITTSVEEIIETHRKQVNTLGISLIISLADEKNNLEEMLMFGGDDEMDSFMNHRDIPSHLIGSAAGHSNYFMIFPTATNVPIYIYTAKILNQEDDPESMNRVNLLNLAAFFDTTEYGEGMKKRQIQQTENNENGESYNETFIIPNPRIIVPEIKQVGDNLHFYVRYVPVHLLFDENDESDYSLSEQVIIFVNGVESYKEIEVLLYVANYKIMRRPMVQENSLFPLNSTEKHEFWNVQDITEWSWTLVPQRLSLNKKRKRFVESVETPPPQNQTVHLSKSDNYNQEELPENSTNANPISPTKDNTRYIFLSSEDIFEYREIGSPLNINSDPSSGAIDLKKSFYKNGKDLILTNKLDPDPAFSFGFGNDDDDVEDTSEKFTIILMDIKEAMEEEDFSITLYHSESESDEENEEEIQEPLVLTFDNFEEIESYAEAVIKMEEKKHKNWLTLQILFLLLILLSLLGVTLIILFVRKYFVNRRQTYNVEIQKISDPLNNDSASLELLNCHWSEIHVDKYPTPNGNASGDVSTSFLKQNTNDSDGVKLLKCQMSYIEKYPKPNLN